MSPTRSLPIVSPRDPAHDVLPWRERKASAGKRLVALELLSDVAVKISSSLDLQETLETVAAAVVDSLGFDVAVLNLVVAEQVDVAAVAGPQDVRDALLGTSQPLATWQALLDQSSPLRSLRFVDGRRGAGLAGLLSWIPDIPISDDPRDWHPEDALFAPLYDGAGRLIGVLSVDLPRNGRRPGDVQVALLERFAVMAGLAVERAHMHQQARDSAELFRRTFEDAPLGMALVDLEGRIDQVNSMYAAMVGERPEALAGTYCGDLAHEQDRSTVRHALRLVAEGALPLVEGEIRDRSGTRWAQVTASKIDGPLGPRLLVQLLDVTEQRLATAALRAQATTDVLTGLRNRASLYEHLVGLLAEPADTARGRAAVVFFDVDLFKLVNDTHGHAAGDQLLVHIASAVASELRGGDTAARLGGDEFVVVLAACDGPSGAIAAAERLRAAICRPVQVGGREVVPSVSMGIALADPDVDAQQLLADADTALYRAKQAGRGGWELFAHDMRDEAVARLRLREELRNALATDQLRLHYQPLVELESGRTIGFEALLRWQHPERGLLLPGEFLGELMHGDLACSATDWVIDEAIREAASWPVTPEGGPFVSVNVSPDQLLRADLPAIVHEALQRHGLEPARLWVEVTEESIVSGPAQLSALHALRRGGVHIALDDFGSGYAGLLALRDLPADVIKLDRAFTRTVQSDPTTRAIVEAVVTLCATLDRTLLAEGLESAEDVEALRALGVSHGQGWFFGRPRELTATSTPAVVRARRSTDLPGELRRVDAALHAATDELQLARVALQAARRIARIDGGSLVVTAPEDQLRTVLAEGYPEDLLRRFQRFSLSTPLPLCEAVLTGSPVWLPAEAMREVLHEVMPVEQRTHVVLAALPLAVEGRALGALGVSWTTPIDLDEVVRAHLTTLAQHVAEHLHRLSVSGNVAGPGRPTTLELRAG